MSIQRSPLIFALKHLHIQWDDGDVPSPSQFRRSASLMQGDRKIPPASDATVEAFLVEECHGELPQAIELKLLEMSCPGWPQDVAIAFHGVSTFGANAIENAKACAQHVLKAHRDCTLARQLVSLLTAKSDVRCTFGKDVKDAPDIPRLIAAETGADRISTKPESPAKIRFKCPGCSVYINAPPQSAGRKAKCPGCATLVTVPAAVTKPVSPRGPAPGFVPQKAKRAPSPSPHSEPPGDTFSFLLEEPSEQDRLKEEHLRNQMLKQLMSEPQAIPVSSRPQADKALPNFKDRTRTPSVLYRALQESDGYVRRQAVRTLAEMEGVAALPALLKLLDDPMSDLRTSSSAYRGRQGIREEIVEALGAIAETSAVPALMGVLQENDAEIVVAAVRALRAISERNPEIFHGDTGHDRRLALQDVWRRTERNDQFLETTGKVMTDLRAAVGEFLSEWGIYY